MTGLVLFVIALVMPTKVHAIAGNPEPGVTTSDSAIITTGDIELNGIFEVHEGDVCSRLGNINLGKKKQVNITTSGDPDWIISVATGTLTCDRATLTHVRGITAPTSRCKIDAAGPALACPSDPTVVFPPFIGIAQTQCTPGNPLTPGDYGDVIIPKATVCTFDGPGVYKVKSLQARKGSELIFKGPNPNICLPAERFDIFVEDFVRIEEFAVVNRAKEGAVYINVAGADGAGGRKNRCPKGLDPGNKASAAFCSGGDGHDLNVCWAYVPNGTVSVAGSVDIEGQIFSKFLSQKGKFNVTLTLPDASCCIPPPPEPPDCACYIEFAPVAGPAGSLIQMNGHNFVNDPSASGPKRTVDFVAFIPEGTNIPANPLNADVEACLVTNPNITSISTLEFNIPSTCPSGIYQLILINDLGVNGIGPWCSNGSLLFEVTN